MYSSGNSRGTVCFHAAAKRAAKLASTRAASTNGTGIAARRSARVGRARLTVRVAVSATTPVFFGVSVVFLEETGGTGRRGAISRARRRLVDGLCGLGAAGRLDGGRLAAGAFDPCLLATDRVGEAVATGRLLRDAERAGRASVARLDQGDRRWRVQHAQRLAEVGRWLLPHRHDRWPQAWVKGPGGRTSTVKPAGCP